MNTFPWTLSPGVLPPLEIPLGNKCAHVNLSPQFKLLSSLADCVWGLPRQVWPRVLLARQPREDFRLAHRDEPQRENVGAKKQHLAQVQIKPWLHRRLGSRGLDNWSGNRHKMLIMMFAAIQGLSPQRLHLRGRSPFAGMWFLFPSLPRVTDLSQFARACPSFKTESLCPGKHSASGEGE